MSRPGGTEGYSEEAEALVRQYESISFADLHREVLHLVPAEPGRVLDIGSGTGRERRAPEWFRGPRCYFSSDVQLGQRVAWIGIVEMQ